MNELILRNGRVMTADGVVEADVLVRNGEVAEIGTVEAPADAEELDCSGAWVGPGFVDLHTHLREPGEEWKEDIASGSAAAAAGGFTAVVAMPNTAPAIDAGHLARFVRERGEAAGLVTVAPAGALTAGRAGERLAHLDELWDAGVRVFSDDGDTVADAGLLRRAMEYLAQLGGVVAQHAVDPGLARNGQMHEGTLSSRLGMQGIPVEAETVVLARDLDLVRLTGVRYHCQHISSARAVELIAAAKEEGLPVTAEVTPHHLMFDHTVVENTNSVYKMTPPLRDETDRVVLVEALASGVIDTVATDHAPHAAHEKDVPWEHAPFGVTGLEWAAAVTRTTTTLDERSFFERLSVTPARIAGLEEQGRWLEPGAPANLVVFDPVARWTPDSTRSKSANAPYLGRELQGTVRATVFGGTPVFAHGIVRSTEFV